MHNNSMSTSDLNPQPARVLIVDDHPNTAEMLARVIRKLETPVEVLTASSGEDALQQLGDDVADILITDFMMPGMSGLELIEKLQDGRKPAHTILITAYDTPGLSITIPPWGIIIKSLEVVVCFPFLILSLTGLVVCMVFP